LAPMLDRMGVLTLADGFALERLCECYAEIREHQTTLALLGSTYDTKSVAGEPMTRARPEVAMRSDADRRFAAYLAQFGLTPAARTKVKVSDGAQADPLERYFTPRPGGVQTASKRP
jgi:P27 family predicted phage terminase small subunit